MRLCQSASAAELVGLAIDEMAVLFEVVVDVGVDRGELLKRLHSPEA